MTDSVMRITLNLQDTNTLVSLRARRGDTGRKLLIHLSDGGVPYGIAPDCYAVFTAARPDGSKLHHPCEIENNVISYTFTEQTCAAPGTLHCEIRLYGADHKLLTSSCFLLTVTDTVYREGDEISAEGEMTTLDALISDAAALMERMEQQLEDSQVTGGQLCYVAVNHGVRPDNPDNTAAMQALMDTVHKNGGGIIWLPIGEYRFDSANSVAENPDFRTILTPRSGVSIIGESLSGTVIKVYGETEQGASWLANYIPDDSDRTVKLSGCTYRNFTVDMSEATLRSYSSTGKALGMKALKDCVFRNLRLLNTPSTALGIDMLDNVVIDSVYVYKGGREWQPGGQGGAGIGIGTGKWENENYVIRNCLCVECGHFGIFLEDQGIFSGAVRNYPEGLTVTGNVVRGGRHYGIGVRGGQNVLITGNNIYSSKGGIYLDYGVRNILVSNNIIADCTEAGILFGTEDAGFGDYPCENVAVTGNCFFRNHLAISTQRQPVNSSMESNIFLGNGSDSLTRIPLDETRILQGKFINDAGEIADHQTSWLYDAFIDLETTMVSYAGGDEGSEDMGYQCPRIAMYDENHSFLKRINKPCREDRLRTVIEEALLEAGIRQSCRYIKFGDNCSGRIGTTLQLYAMA